MLDDEIPLMLEREAGMPENIPQVAVGFGLVPAKDDAESQKQGRPIFKDREFCKIVIPGDKQSCHLQPATDRDRERFPQAYMRFKQRETTPNVGTPLEQWPALSRAEAMSLKAMNIMTVEMLAELHDGTISKMGFGTRELVAKAKAFLAHAKDSAAAQKLAAENEAKDRENAELRRTIADLAKRIENMEGKRKAA